MAQKDTLEIDVNVGEGVKSMKTLKKEFAEMQTELDGLTPGTQKYIDTLKRLGAVKDEIGDLKSEIQAFAGTDAKIAAFGNVIGGIASGFQAAQGAAALFGAESEDVQKALLKVQAAAALADGIKGIAAMGDSLKVAGNVAKQLITQLIGVETTTKIVTTAQRIWNAVISSNPIGLMVFALAAAAGAVYTLIKAFDESSTAADRAEQSYQRLADATKEISRQIENEITALSGLKSNESEIIELKRKKFQLDIASLKLGIEAANQKAEEQQREIGFWDKVLVFSSKVNGGLITEQQLKNKNSEESLKLAKERTAELEKISAEFTAFENSEEQKRIDKKTEANKKFIDENKKLHDAYLAARKAELEALDNAIQQSHDINRKIRKDEQDAIDKEQQEQADKDFAALELKLAKEKELKDKAAEDEKQSKEAIQQAEVKSIEALSSLSAGYFAFRLRAAQGNAAEELKVKKQMFAVDKAFNIARAIQDGIRSVQAALTIPPPGGQILAGINAAIAAGNVAQIAATQFDGGGSGGSVNIGSSGNANFSQVPNISGGSSGNNTTNLNENGTVNGNQKQAPIQAFLVETQASATQKRLDKLSNQAKIG